MKLKFHHRETYGVVTYAILVALGLACAWYARQFLAAAPFASHAIGWALFVFAVLFVGEVVQMLANLTGLFGSLFVYFVLALAMCWWTGVWDWTGYIRQLR